MIKLCNFLGKKGVPEYSPFTMKLELYLRVMNIEYETLSSEVHKSPRKKLPYIIDGDNTISDTEHCISYIEKKYSVNIDESLSKEKKVESYCLTKLADEYGYFILLYSRWIDPEGWSQIKELYFGSYPFFVRKFIVPMVKKGVVKTLYGHGLGRHTREQIYNFGEEFLENISVILGEKDYFGGDRPSRADISLLPLLYNIGASSVKTEFTLRYEKFSGLNKYVNKMLDKYFE